jgi:hypothetical protein
MKKFFLSIFSILLCVSCSSENENPTPPEDEQGNTQAPEIYIETFPDIIETASSFQISVTDESDVTTQIYIDDVLVTEATAKTIDFDIDPFDYTIGEKTLRIISTNANDNVETVSIPFELKKLLFRLPEPVSDNPFIGSDLFLSVNFDDGTLYKSKRIETDEDGTFYADDDFERQDFIVSLYRISNPITINYNYYDIYSFSNIAPGTELLSTSQRFDFFNLGNLHLDQFIYIDLIGITKPRLEGYNGRILHSYNETYSFSTNSQAPEFYFLYSFPDFGNAIDDYAYTVISDLGKTTYAASDLSPATEFASITLPNQATYSFGVEAYKSEEDYGQNRGHSIFGSISHFNSSSYTFDVPIFPDVFDTYNLFYTTTLNSKLEYSMKQKGMVPPVISNDLQITKNGQNISIDGEHDYSKIWFQYGFDVPNTQLNLFNWTFYGKESTALELPMENFEIPLEVLDLYGERGVLPRPSQQTDDNFSYDLEVYNHSDSVIYENMMFGGDYNQNEGGDVIWLTYDLKD